MNSIPKLARAAASSSRLQQASTIRNFRVSASSNNENPHDNDDEDIADPFSNLLATYAALPCDGYGASATIYDARKYSHFLPDCNPCRVNFEVPRIMPFGIFRCTADETLGPGAGKCVCYKNPEYYAYHNMSFFDIHLYLSSHRNPVPDSKRKP